MKYENIEKYKKLGEVLDADLPGPLTKMTEKEYNFLYGKGYRKVGDLVYPHNGLLGRGVAKQLEYIKTTHFYNLLLKRFKEQDKKIKQIGKELKRKIEIISNHDKEIKKMIDT